MWDPCYDRETANRIAALEDTHPEMHATIIQALGGYPDEPPINGCVRASAWRRCLAVLRVIPDHEPEEETDE